MRRLTLAVATAAALAPGLAAAQSMDEMRQGLSMLETNAAMIIDRHGIDVDPMSLSLSQIAQILRAAENEGDMGRLTASRLQAILN